VPAHRLGPPDERFGGSFDTLSPKQQALVQFIVQNPSFSSYATARELAERVGVDPSTVVRLAQVLGFKGYIHFRHSLRHLHQEEVSDGSRLQDGREIRPASPFVRQILSDLNNLKQLLGILDEEGLSWLARQIASARNVLVISSGSYSALATVLSHLCQGIGYPVRAELRAGSYLAPAISTLGPGDLVLGIDLWRASRDHLLCLQWAKKNGATTAVLTDTAFSPVVRVVDQAIIIPSEGNLFFQSLTSGLSIIYGLVAALWELDPERSARKLAETRELQHAQGLELAKGTLGQEP